MQWEFHQSIILVHSLINNEIEAIRENSDLDIWRNEKICLQHGWVDVVDEDGTVVCSFPFNDFGRHSNIRCAIAAHGVRRGQIRWTACLIRRSWTASIHTRIKHWMCYYPKIGIRVYLGLANLTPFDCPCPFMVLTTGDWLTVCEMSFGCWDCRGAMVWIEDPGAGWRSITCDCGITDWTITWRGPPKYFSLCSSFLFTISKFTWNKWITQNLSRLRERSHRNFALHLRRDGELKLDFINDFLLQFLLVLLNPFGRTGKCFLCLEWLLLS